MARARPPSDLPGRAGALLRSPLGRLLLCALAGAVVALGIGLVVRQARAHATRMPAYHLDAESLVFLDLPASLGPRGIAALTDPRHHRFRISVFDPRAEAVVREVVSRHPMVASIRGVRIRFPDRVEVRVAVRRPVAWFEVRGTDGEAGYHLYGADGHLLPPQPYEAWLGRLRRPLPVVTGVAAVHPTRAGQRWEDAREQVAEGLSAAAVARRLERDLRGRIHVARIDVGRFPATPSQRDRGEVRFQLAGGAVVEWGRTARAQDDVAREDPYETKAWRLRQLIIRGEQAEGRLDVRFPVRGEERRPGLIAP